MINCNQPQPAFCYPVFILLIGMFLFALSEPASAGGVVDIYQQKVPQMTTLECGKCHLQVFETLRDAGGQHQLECRDCHERFHTFTPGIPWEERVPSCASCHGTPHGEDLTDCLSCHGNAHAPIAALVHAEQLTDLCSRCHQQQQQELQQEQNPHGGQDCVDCHQSERHGESPQCLLCHEDPHTPYVDNQGCVSCHPPHQPQNVNYSAEIPNDLCGGCHAAEQQALESTSKKHQLLACTVCHPKQHGAVTSCRDCHANGPHNPTLLKNFESCGDCHGDPHQLKL